MPAPQAEALRKANRSLSQKDGAFQLAASLLVPGLAGSIPLRSGSVCCNLESLMDVSLLAFKAKCLGCSSLRCRP